MTIGVVACGYADGYPRHAPDRHAGAGQRQAHAHRWTRIDGHDLRRHQRHSRGLHRHAGDAVGRGPVGRRGGAPRPARSATSCCARWRRACRWPRFLRALMAKTKTAYVCSDCGATALQWFGSCPSCGAAGHAERDRRGTRPAARAAVGGRAAGRAGRDRSAATCERIAHRRRRARPRARRRPGRRAGGPARRRPGHRQVDAAPAGAWLRAGHASALYVDRRGVGRAGGAARAAPGARRRRACACSPRPSSSASSARWRTRGRASR